MNIKWLGHALFLITLQNGTKIATDPYDDSIGYKLGEIEADIVTSSHDHFDHNYIKRVKGKPQIFNKEGKEDIKGVKFTGISTFHDKEGGKARGKNLVIVIEADNITLCHLGDLGDVLSTSQVNQIGKVDILFVPVGGTFTIDAKDAEKVVNLLSPKIVIPMHYKTKDLTFNIDGVEKFIQGKDNVKKVKELNITADMLPTVQEIVVMEY